MEIDDDWHAGLILPSPRDSSRSSGHAAHRMAGSNGLAQGVEPCLAAERPDFLLIQYALAAVDQAGHIVFAAVAGITAR